MNDETKQIMRSAKCARIITCISNMHNISLNEATDVFYNSDTANMIEEGIADLQCRSDKYLAEEIWDEYQSAKQ